MIRAPDSSASTDGRHGLSAFDDRRLGTLRRWLLDMGHRHALALDTLRPASDDASFRRYFRIDARRGPAPSLVVMDAPPALEDCRPFVRAAAVLQEAGLKVPAVIESDLDEGFLLLEDLGTETLLDRLARDPGDTAIDRLYRGAIEALVTMQAASRPGLFPNYDRELLERELMLFPDWYLSRHLGFELSDADRRILRTTFDLLLEENLGQPRVFVHRDYHSRNLMTGVHGSEPEAASLPAPAPAPAPAAVSGVEPVAGNESSPGSSPEWSPGVIDFQDAVYGPITYDLVSLLRDAYVSWPEERQIDWAVRWWQSARAAGLPVPADFGELWRSFEWMGMQRHLKVLGIFARLHHRDGKSRYLADIPRVLASVVTVARRYDAFSGLLRLIERSGNAAVAAGAGR